MYTTQQIGTDFQTPLFICEYMVSLLPDTVNSVFEPTPGKGNLVTTAKNKGFNVTAAADYFLHKKTEYDAVLMNPPFSEKYAILDNAPVDFSKKGMRLGYHILSECLEMAPVVIALMPWFTLTDSDVRTRKLKDYGLKSVTTLPRKTFEYSRIQTVVLELNRGYTGITEFKVFDRL